MQNKIVSFGNSTYSAGFTALQLTSLKNEEKIFLFELLLFTVYLSTWIVGLAEGYNRNIKFIPTPDKIPYSTPMTRQNKKVTNIGMRSFLLDFHISFTTSYSIIYITAQMITADNEAKKRR
jgi:hypothetical protein